jgi:peptidylprolyl isomerase
LVGYSKQKYDNDFVVQERPSSSTGSDGLFLFKKQVSYIEVLRTGPGIGYATNVMVRSSKKYSAKTSRQQKEIKNMTEAVKAGDTISVNYTGKFEDGEIFDTSEGREPLTFTVGTGQLIKGFDDAVVGMKKGDTKSITITPEDGYGEHQEELVIDMPRTNIPEDMELAIGLPVNLVDQSGNPIPAVVTEILDDVVKMDVNHPLAGKTLVFNIAIVATGLEPAPMGCGDSCGGCSSCG